jgi:oxygen-dependent protoporphyrinogen oxidase
MCEPGGNGVNGGSEQGAGPIGTARQAEAHVAVVGGGIAGLAAAYFLRDSGARVTLFECSPRIGGKLAVSEVAGIGVDEGAEAMLARRPEGTDLAAAVGLAGELVSPATTAAAIWTRGALRPLPAGQLMGVPGDLAALARSGVLSPGGLARAGLDLLLPATRRAQDVTVGRQVAARLGREVVDRLVEPLLGGVYAGRAWQLSFEATLPGLAEASRSHRTLTGAARSALAAARRSGARGEQPVFTTLAGGLGTLAPAVAAASGARVRTGAAVRELRRTEAGWRLTVGSAAGPGSSAGSAGADGPAGPAGSASPAGRPEYVHADAVVLAVPAGPAGRLLGSVAPTAAAALAEIEYASMAIVTLVFAAAAIRQPLRGSGFLVPAVDGRAVKAVTFSTVKWPHLRAAMDGAEPTAPATAGAGHEVVRCSIGRLGEERLLQRADEELAALACAELAMAVPVAGSPVATRVSRWGGGLPQYTVGHLGRVARIRTAVAGQPGLAVCGAAYDGVGVPACVATARQAAQDVTAYLAQRPGIRADGGQ